MPIHENTSLVSSLKRLVDTGASGEDIAQAIATLWRLINLALCPIIGQAGVAALFKRSLLLTTSAHPWLPTGLDPIEPGLDLTALLAALSQQSGASAASGGGAMLQTFYELLATLVGPSLTERLLASVRETTSSGAPAQDSLP